MRYFLFCLLALFLFQCEEKELPIIEKPVSEPLVLNKPCYDSTYFDTTLIMMNIQFTDFTLKAPQGAIYKKAFFIDTEGGHLFYGCDTFTYSYGNMVNSTLGEDQYITIDTIDLNGDTGHLGYGYHSEYDVYYYSLLVNGDNDINYLISITNPHYYYYANNLFHSFRLK